MKIQSTKNKQRRSRMARGFSLFEMVIVMGIIGAILGSVIFLSKGFGDSAKLQTADQDFTTLISHLEAYKINGRNYPTQAQGLDALVNKPTSSPLPRRWVQSIPNVPNDPWGKPYQYKFPGSKNANDPEIISSGPDGILGNDDDLSSQD